MLTRHQIDSVVSLSKESAKIAIKHKESSNYDIIRKSDGTDTTSADLEISEFLRENLGNIYNVPVVCEEMCIDSISSDSFWLIDPIDGTNSFISGGDEFAINVALISDRKPVFGLINAPLFRCGKIMYNTCDGEVELIVSEEKKIITKDSLKAADVKDINIVTSRRTKNFQIENYLNWYKKSSSKSIKTNKALKISSAVKFFNLIEGSSNLYLHFSRTMEWDIAAGHAIVSTLGGKIKTLSCEQSFESFSFGDEITYQKPGFANPPFACSITIEL